MDQLSSLPITILHDVLSRLPYKEATRTSILSKAWKETWSTFPILFFDESRYKDLLFRKYQENPKRLEYYGRQTQKFLLNVDTTLQRFTEKGLVGKELKLKTGFSDRLYKMPRLDFWLDTASKIGVQVLELELITPASSLDEVPQWDDECYKYYNLPPSVLKYTSLVKLILSGPISLDQSFLNHQIRFASLQVLSLMDVHLSDEQVIHNIISCCPLIEYITLKTCLGLDSMTLHNLPKLKGIKVWRIANIIVVDAPKLEKFHLVGDITLPPMLNLDMCKNLAGLILERSGITIDTQWLCETFHKFPLLERLELIGSTMSLSVHLSSAQLKVLRIIRGYKLVELQIDAPNLYFFECGIINGDNVPAIAFLNRSRQLEVNVSTQINHPRHLPSFRKFLANIKCRNVLASLDLRIMHPAEEWNLVEAQDISVSPPRIKHLKLQLSLFTTNKVACSSLIMMLLWCCRPTIISMKFSLPTDIIFVELLCKKLMRLLKGMSNCYCCFKNSNCWLERCYDRFNYNLEDIKVTISSRIDEKSLDCKSFLDALPTLPPEEDISFWLEW
ncbi:hypothetical protein RIF29_28150 [Crotalaria pallida]|uniref:F-box domain-containing protein n=1 Tax=Crotalaria pallida TaxID=3830 RepID=A0AAN9ERG2_CROPI